MFRYIIPIILIAVAIAGFFVFASPIYQDINGLRAQTASYNEALDNSKALENERDKLTAKSNAISPENLDRLSKFLPDNVDNIRLILEIERVAAPYGMLLKDIKYNPVAQAATTAPVPGAAPETAITSNDYAAWDLEFSTQGTYTNFINFTRALESNLRIVDISSIDFSSSTGVTGGASPTSNDVYKYSFKIKTYWLKN